MSGASPRRSKDTHSALTHSLAARGGISFDEDCRDVVGHPENAC